MKFIFVKLLAYIEHAANLLKIDLPAESFWNKFQKMAALKMVFWEEKFLVGVPALHSLQFKQKQIMLKLSDEAMKIMMYLQRNWWKLFFSEIVALESIPAFLLKTDSTTNIFGMGSAR